MEGLQRSHSVLGWNDSRGVFRSWDVTTPRESFCPGMERLQGSHSILGWNDSKGVILSWDGTTLKESFCLGMERLLLENPCAFPLSSAHSLREEFTLSVASYTRNISPRAIHVLAGLLYRQFLMTFLQLHSHVHLCS